MNYDSINELIKTKENEVNRLLLEIKELKSKLDSKVVVQELIPSQEKIKITKLF